jgi:hypothetical protein
MMNLKKGVMQMTVFWDVAQCNMVESHGVSWVLIASIIIARKSLENVMICFEVLPRNYLEQSRKTHDYI